jgi:hypothetical protein
MTALSGFSGYSGFSAFSGFAFGPILTIELSASSVSAGTKKFTIQVKDHLGVNYQGRAIVMFWKSSSAFGAPEAGMTVSESTGKILLTTIADVPGLVMTDETGLAEINGTNAAATVHFMASISSQIVSTSIIFT